METTVECAHCGAIYQTTATPTAIREVRRCEQCGVAALAIAVDDEPVREEDASGAV